MIPVINEDARLYQQLRAHDEPIKFPPGVSYHADELRDVIADVAKLTNGRVRDEDPCNVRGSFLDTLIGTTSRPALREWLESEARADVIAKINARLAAPRKRTEAE